MFWETLWPLILGFTLSGAVQELAQRNVIQTKLGNHRPFAIARASGLGMMSSSCSYAASAMAKSLFAKGADFVTAMVFMFASTNLVIELGIVLVVLIGWQFAVGELVGGTIMILVLGAVGGLWLRGDLVERAKQRLATVSPADGKDGSVEEAVSDEVAEPLRVRLRSRTSWAAASTYTVADLKMLRRELAVGYLFAGFIATLVPVHFWNALFLHGHGWLTTIENVAVGPFLAIISFVCSIGNVPLAAALWKGGISFGGVVSFIFADLITFPLLLIYRRYYGTKLMLGMLAVFWGVMSLAGLATEAIFRGAGIIPTKRPGQIAAAHFSWNYTTALNLLFLVIGGLVYWTYRHRDRFIVSGYAMDPVCGMQVTTADAPASTMYHGTNLYFCSDRCLARFEADPSRFQQVADDAPSGGEQPDRGG